MAKAEVSVVLFCGVGGFCLGSEAAGVPVVLAVDCWRAALDVHAANFPKCRRERITLGGPGGSVENLLRLIAETVDGRPYHLHLSPPCQNSSNANAKGDREAASAAVAPPGSGGPGSGAGAFARGKSGGIRVGGKGPS